MREPARRDSRGAQGRHDPVLRPRRVHDALRPGGSGGRQETLATYHRRVRREIERFGGTVEKFIGDAVMAVTARPWRTRTTRNAPCSAALRIPLRDRGAERRRTETAAGGFGSEWRLGLPSSRSVRSDPIQGHRHRRRGEYGLPAAGRRADRRDPVGEGHTGSRKTYSTTSRWTRCRSRARPRRSASGSLRPPEAGSEPSSNGGSRPRSWAGATSSSSSSTRSRARDENHPCSSSRCSGSRAWARAASSESCSRTSTISPSWWRSGDTGVASRTARASRSGRSGRSSRRRPASSSPTTPAPHAPSSRRALPRWSRSPARPSGSGRNSHRWSASPTPRTTVSSRRNPSARGGCSSRPSPRSAHS